MLSKIREFFSKVVNMLLLAVLEIVIGLFMLISPSGLAIGILIAMGVLLLADGVVRVITYFKEPVAEAKKKHKLFTGLFLLVCGLFFLFNSSYVVGLFPFLAALYGLLALLAVFLKVEMVVTLMREKHFVWYVMTCSALFSLLATLILYGSPVPFIGTAILFFVAAGLDFVYYLYEQKKISIPTIQVLMHSISSRIMKHEKDNTNPASTIQTAPEAVPAYSVRRSLGRSSTADST